MLQYLFMYADDLMVLSPQDFCSTLMDSTHLRDANELDWLYPLSDCDGEPILGFEAEESEVLEDGSSSGHFFCLTVLLGPVVHDRRSVTYCPYNVRHSFDFVYPALTHYASFTPESVKRAALSTMVPYAIVGSSHLDDAYRFLTVVCDRLFTNTYPRHVILDMWEVAYHRNVLTLPCRWSLHSELDTLYHRVTAYISS